MFNVDSYFKYNDLSKFAVYHSSDFGPWFSYNALGIGEDPMNRESSGWCCTSNENGACVVKALKEGISPLTGEFNCFTAAECEVFVVY